MQKAFHGICEKYLSEDADGSLHLDGICLVAGLGGKTDALRHLRLLYVGAGGKDDAKGVWPFLLAYTEMRRAGLIEA